MSLAGIRTQMAGTTAGVIDDLVTEAYMLLKITEDQANYLRACFNLVASTKEKELKESGQ